MKLKKIAGAALTVAMLTGLATAGAVSTATTASASGNCYQRLWPNADLAPHLYWVPDHNLAYSPNYEDGCVITLQQELNQVYNAGLATDGYFGNNTLAWVNRFQSDFHCAGGQDGIAGGNTMSCLAWVSGQPSAS